MGAFIFLQLAENKQKKPYQNFSNYQIPLPLPSQNLGVVLYCLSPCKNPIGAWRNERPLLFAEIAQLVEQLICNQ